MTTEMIERILSKENLEEAKCKVMSNKGSAGVDRMKTSELPKFIVSSVSGESKKYEVMVESVDYSGKEENKGILIRVTDPELLELTGGIVQGMSGSPIIQDGKLIGAVTHVLVNDPTRGYGIFIEKML